MKLQLQQHDHPIVGVVMGSDSDWPTMLRACEILEELGVPYEYKVVSAHRTPDRLRDYAKTASERNLLVIIAGAGGAAHLPGMLAAEVCPSIPILGVPVKSSALSGVDSLFSIVQMPGGVPVATFSIGEAGAKNAALHAAAILSRGNEKLREALIAWRKRLSESVPLTPTVN